MKVFKKGQRVTVPGHSEHHDRRYGTVVETPDDNPVPGAVVYVCVDALKHTPAYLSTGYDAKHVQEAEK